MMAEQYVIFCKDHMTGCEGPYDEVDAIREALAATQESLARGQKCAFDIMALHMMPGFSLIKTNDTGRGQYL